VVIFGGLNVKEARECQKQEWEQMENVHLEKLWLGS
jgi:hypothetical protein